MNLRSANSGGSADPVPPPPPREIFVVLPDGSCIPATARTLKIVLRQARSEATKQARLAAAEKASELQRSLEDRAAARRFLQELAEIERDRRRIAATLRGKVKADRPLQQTSSIIKRASAIPSRTPRPIIPAPSPRSAAPRALRGVHYNQTYIGRNSPGFYRGAARDRWFYEARDEAVLLDEHGHPIIISNIGDDLDEIGVGWQALEDATTRKNGKAQIRIIVALDADATDAEKTAALQHFCKSVLEPLGLPYSAVIHRAPGGGDARNCHAHILTNFRPTERIGPYEWSFAGHVCGELDGRDGIQMLRHLWAHSMTEAAEKAERNMRYTGLGYGARGLNLEPGQHLGEARCAMVRRGTTVWTDERNRLKNARNVLRQSIRDTERKIAALTHLRGAVVAQMWERETEASAPRKLAHAKAPQPPVPLIAPATSNVQQTPTVITTDRKSPPVRMNATGPVKIAPLTALRDSREESVPPPTLFVAGHLPALTPPRVASKAVWQPRSITADIPGMVSGHLWTSACDRYLLAPLSCSQSAGEGQHPTHLAAARTAATADRRPPLQHARPRGMPVNDKLAQTIRLSPPPPCVASAPISASSGADPAKVIKPSSPAGARAAPISSWKPSDSRDVIAMRMASLLAALEGWRDSACGMTLARPDAAAPTKKAQDIGIRQAGGPQANSTATSVTLPPAIRAYRKRRKIAKGADASRRSSIEAVPDREWLEGHPRTVFDDRAMRALEHDERLFERLRKADIYVGDFKDGSFGLDPRMAAALKVDDDWFAQRHVQRALSTIRGEQQKVIASMGADARARPLDFATVGLRFWPNDLAPNIKMRLDRWGNDEFFGGDVFAIEIAVRQAHSDDAVAKSRRQASLPSSVKVAHTRGITAVRPKRPQTGDGDQIDVRLFAFAKGTNKPTRPLLLLLRVLSV